jgi:hypothetical protein
LAVIAALGVSIFVGAEPALAGSAEGLAGLHADVSMRPPLSVPILFHHSQRTQAFYCYPRNYWWFYRPYTTASDGHARCMPYFHYLAPADPRGARSGRYIK